MFSQTVEYALRAVVALAEAYPEVRTTAEVAARIKVPTAYLSKVLQALRRAELASSRRGKRGGVALVVAPRDLDVLRVVRAVEPFERITTCPLGLPQHGSKLCPLHSRLDAALAQIEEAFGRTTIAEMLEDRSRSAPLCAIPKRK